MGIYRLELDLARSAKRNKKGFYRYVSHKRKVQEGTPTTLVNKTDWLVTTGEEKAQILNSIFTSVFIGNCSSHA